MIKLKNKINKTQLVKEAKEWAQKYYEGCYEKELRIGAYLVGINYILKEMQDRSRKLKTKFV